jgi:CRP-like cAMP-binding protein
MLPVEQEPIKLPRIEFEIEQKEGRRIRYLRSHDNALVEVTLPHRYGYLWQQVRLGASVYDLAIRMRSGRMGPRVFLEISSFLAFLIDHDIVDDVRLVRMLDSIRGEFEWPEDLLQSPSWKSAIFQWGRSSGSSQENLGVHLFSRFLEGIAFSLVAVSLPLLMILLIGIVQQLLKIAHLEPFQFIFKWDYIVIGALGGLFFIGTLGRSFASVLRMANAKSGGEAGELSFVVDLMGPYLDFQPFSMTGQWRRLGDFLLIFSGATALVLSLLGFQYLRLIPFSKLHAFGPLLLIYTSLASFALAMSTHPAAKSHLTRSLRIWNRNPLKWREDDELIEVESFHQAGAIISHVFMLLAVTGIGTLTGISWGSGSRAAPSLSALLIGLTILIIYLEPLLANRFPGYSKLNRRRRMWATKAKILDVAAADREAWSELPVLRQLTAPVRARLLASARVVEFRPGQFVCRQGGADRSLFIVLNGKLGVAKSFQGRRRKVVAILTAGGAFGETAFFFGTPRTADVVAIENSQLLEIPYFESMKKLDISSSEEFQFRVWLLQALSGNSMLKDLPSEAMDTLIFAGRRRMFRAGEVIFTEGAPADSCYFIAQGRASAIQQGKKITEMGTGDAFGEIALLSAGGRRTATVVADSDLLCMELDIENFWALLAARLPLGAEIERLAILRLQADEARRSLERAM